MLEKYLVQYCAPTLARLKTANLFRIACQSVRELDEMLEEWNGRLADKGVSMTILAEQRDGVLVYVYRRSFLERDLSRPASRAFLAGYGYGETDADRALERLRQRMEQGEEFPHEIGVFLGYPLADVIGFIENGGKNCICCGCWKVYCDEWEARKTFARYKKCTEVYCRLHRDGRTIRQLTVVA